MKPWVALKPENRSSSDETVVVLTEDDPQWSTLQRTIVTQDGEGSGVFGSPEQMKAKCEPNATSFVKAS